MNQIAEIKQQAMTEGLRRAALVQIGKVSNRTDNGNYQDALANLKVLTPILEELVKLNKSRKQRSDKGTKRAVEPEPEMFPLPVEDKIVNVPVKKGAA